MKNNGKPQIWQNQVIQLDTAIRVSRMLAERPGLEIDGRQTSLSLARTQHSYSARLAVAVTQQCQAALASRAGCEVAVVAVNESIDHHTFPHPDAPTVYDVRVSAWTPDNRLLVVAALASLPKYVPESDATVLGVKIGRGIAADLTAALDTIIAPE